MVDNYFNALSQICAHLEADNINWAITGSLGMALQGISVAIHDIDIQTDAAGAYEIEHCFAHCVTRPVQYVASEHIRSHFGTFELDGIRVEIMGDLQKQLSDQSWEDPVKVEQYRQWLEINGLSVPVLSLAYEYQAYLKLGRLDKAKLLKDWLTMQPRQKEEEDVQPTSDP